MRHKRVLLEEKYDTDMDSLGGIRVTQIATISTAIEFPCRKTVLPDREPDLKDKPTKNSKTYWTRTRLTTADSTSLKSDT